MYGQLGRRQDIKKSAEEVTATLANYEKQIGQFNESGQFNGSISSGKSKTFTSEAEQQASDIDREKLIYTAKEIGRFLQTLGLRADVSCTADKYFHCIITPSLVGQNNLQ